MSDSLLPEIRLFVFGKKAFGKKNAGKSKLLQTLVGRMFDYTYEQERTQSVNVCGFTMESRYTLSGELDLICTEPLLAQSTSACKDSARSKSVKDQDRTSTLDASQHPKPSPAGHDAKRAWKITIWNFGEQPVFQTSQALFVDGTGIFMFVLDGEALDKNEFLESIKRWKKLQRDLDVPDEQVIWVLAKQDLRSGPSDALLNCAQENCGKVIEFSIHYPWQDRSCQRLIDAIHFSAQWLYRTRNEHFALAKDEQRLLEILARLSPLCSVDDVLHEWEDSGFSQAMTVDVARDKLKTMHARSQILFYPYWDIIVSDPLWLPHVMRVFLRTTNDTKNKDPGKVLAEFMRRQKYPEVEGVEYGNFHENAIRALLQDHVCFLVQDTLTGVVGESCTLCGPNGLVVKGNCLSSHHMQPRRNVSVRD